jgi:hypothetical protein
MLLLLNFRHKSLIFHDSTSIDSFIDVHHYKDSFI